MNVLGIDPGLTGGLAVVDANGRLLAAWETPRAADGEIDLSGFTALVLKAIYQFNAQHAFLEKVSSMPGQGVASMFKFGLVYGAAQGILAARSVPFTLIVPRSWQKLAFEGVREIRSADRQRKDGTLVKGKVEPKKMAAVAASRLFPGADLSSSKGSPYHEGKVDAALIALIGARKLNGTELR